MSGCSLSTPSQNALSVCAVNLSLRVESDVISMNWSSPVELKSSGGAALNGSHPVLSTVVWEELLKESSQWRDVLLKTWNHYGGSSITGFSKARFSKESVFPWPSRCPTSQAFGWMHWSCQPVVEGVCLCIKAEDLINSAFQIHRWGRPVSSEIVHHLT